MTRESGDFRRHRAHYDVTVMWNNHDQCIDAELPIYKYIPMAQSEQIVTEY